MARAAQVLAHAWCTTQREREGKGKGVCVCVADRMTDRQSAYTDGSHTARAAQVLAHVRCTTALLSLALNLIHRGHELANTLLVMLATVMFHERAVLLPYVGAL